MLRLLFKEEPKTYVKRTESIIDALSFYLVH